MNLPSSLLEFFSEYGLILSVIGFWLLRWLYFKRKQTLARTWALDPKTMIIDVRSEAEFVNGHAPGSHNFPLHTLESRINAIPKDTPLLVCCASGTRSAMAKQKLRSLGFHQVENLGPWKNAPTHTEVSPT